MKASNMIEVLNAYKEKYGDVDIQIFIVSKDGEEVATYDIDKVSCGWYFDDDENDVIVIDGKP